MDRSNLQQLNPELAKVFRWLCFSFSLIFLTACATDPDTDLADEGGVVGTGLILQGSVSERRRLASVQLQIRAQSGERSSGVISGGQYLVQSPSGQGPWLLRSDLGNDDFQYGIAHAAGKANVHSYTDLIVRSWFLEQYGISDLNAIFDSQASLPQLPGALQFSNRAKQYFALVKPVLESYQLSEQELLVEPFSDDNQGVDRFLDANPVLINGRNITLVKTDQDNNNVQSFVNSDILLASAAQSTPPAMPENLRAFGSAANTIQLVWDIPADNNNPVISYTVVRNGLVVATTPFQTYQDNDVQANTSYLYEVQAMGIADETSVSASVNINSTSFTVDTLAPATPSSVTVLSASTRQTELAWTQNVADDAIAFTIFRGPVASNLSMLARVNGTRFVDATVSSGLEYWYAISAVDASGNESTRSEPVRVLTTGIVIVPPEPSLNPVLVMADLQVPDADALACDTVFADNQIDDTQVTISAGCYRVEQNINVLNFGVLTLQPGVVLKFDKDTAIKVERTGALVSAGTAAQPVLMSATRPTRGWWHGVEFDHTERALNKIDHTVIEYAGGAKNGASIKLVSASNDPALLSVDNSIIRNGAGYGISIPGLDARLQSFSSNLITQNDRAAAIHSSSLQAINDGSSFSQNDLNFMYVPRSYYDLDLELSDPGIAIELGSIDQVDTNPPRTIIINEGVELRFIDGAAFNVHGNLAIRGTANNPVTLTSKNPNPGRWEGLQLLDGANVELSHLIIENAGLESVENPAGASLFVAGNTRISADNVTLRFSASHGFHAAGGCVTVDKFSQVSRVNNQLDDVVDPAALTPC